MSLPRRLALVALFGLGGCAGRETQASRAAWQKAVRGEHPDASNGANGGTPDDAALADPSAWRDLTKFTQDSAELLSLGVSTAPLPSLVDKLCAEPPEELDNALTPTAVRCPPKPPMDPLGHPLTLELGDHSTIGLAATDLTDMDSAELLALALKQLVSACADPWTRVPSGNREEFHTCAAPSGSMVVLGRFSPEGSGDRWQFSLAVLGPG